MTEAISARHTPLGNVEVRTRAHARTFFGLET